jgi:hypothetical protein
VSSGSASEKSEIEDNLRPKINPDKKQVANFLKNVPVYEEEI